MNLSIRFFYIIISILFSSFIIYLSFHEDYWLKFWTFLNVPTQLPPFSDLDSINRSLLSLKQGFNPYFENPNDISQTRYMYPKIWLYIFDVLNLQDSLNFNIFCFITVFTYCYTILNLSLLFKNKYLNGILAIFFLSTTNFILLERLNIEIIIFIISCLLLTLNSFFKQNILFVLITLLKIFPIFSIIAFIDNKKKFLTVFICSFLIILIFNKEITVMRANMIEYALIVAYGIGTIAKGLYYYSIHLDLFINDNNYSLFRNSLIFLGGCFTILIFFIFFKFGEKKINSEISLHEKFFLFGGGIYIGTYLTSANIDYRLIFLLFTIPYILINSKNYINLFYILSFLICINSFLFEGGNNYSLEYLIKAGIVHGMKFYIFTYIVITISKIINNYLVINYKFNKSTI